MSRPLYCIKCGGTERYKSGVCKSCCRKWHRDNSENGRMAVAKWRASHPDKVKLQKRNWAKLNPEKDCAKTARYKASKLQAIPAWANKFFIEEIYDLAKRRTKVTGFEWHVDHIVPLNSKLVCGLHTHDNLRVIPAIMNISKHNRHWPDMP